MISRTEGYLISRREIGGPLRFLHGDNMIHLKILYVIEAHEFPLCHTQIRMVLNTNFINILCNSFFFFPLGETSWFWQHYKFGSLKGHFMKRISKYICIFFVQLRGDLLISIWWRLGSTAPREGGNAHWGPINLPGVKAIGERVCWNKRAVRRGSFWANLSNFNTKVSICSLAYSLHTLSFNFLRYRFFLSK